jgi:hypothetical protein
MHEEEEGAVHDASMHQQSIPYLGAREGLSRLGLGFRV